jgi:hypothetical protein
MSATQASRIGGVVLLGALLFAASPACGQFLITEGPNLRRARQLEVRTVVVDESNSLWAPTTNPDPRALLVVLSKADMRITHDVAEIELDRESINGGVQMGIGVGQVVWTVNFPLPAPDGSRPYRFWVSARRDNEQGTPIYTLTALQARPLGDILRALLAQKRAP